MLSRSLRRPRATVLTAGSILVAATVLSVGLTSCSGRVAPVDTTGRVEFDTTLVIPRLAESRLDAAGTRVFALVAEPGVTELTSAGPTTTAGYNGSYLGPTLVARRGEKVRVELHNGLAEPTTLHWHGMHLPAAMDGGPHQMVAAGAEWSPEWRIDQPAATLWYHPHPHGETEEQVSMGLAGLFLIEDDGPAALDLPHEYGVDDVPVIVQDVRFTASGEFAEQRGFVGILGDQLLVNGTLGPRFEASTELVRLRLLNASTARTYDFGFDDARSFQQIASDGGLLAAPIPTTSVQLSPGERAEIVVRLVPGQTTTLVSRPPALGVDPNASAGNGGTDRFDVLQVIAAAVLSPSGRVPAVLAAVPRLDAARVAITREFDLNGTQINGENMDPARVDATVTVDTTERWQVENTTGLPHNFHVHDVQFQIESIGGRPPPAALAGWKDTVYLPPHTPVDLLLHFSDYTDPGMPYMYHCHLLWHEDRGMMGQFVVTNPGEQATITEGTHHDH